MDTWPDYINKEILAFRKKYDLSRVMGDPNGSIFPYDPTQVFVYENADKNFFLFLFFHILGYTDRGCSVYSGITKDKLISSVMLFAHKMPKEEQTDLEKYLSELAIDEGADMAGLMGSVISEHISVQIYYQDPRLSAPSEGFAFIWEDQMELFADKDEIRQTIGSIKEEVKKGAQDSALAKIDELEARLVSKIDNDIGSMREIISKSERYTDFKAFAGDLTRLQETHIEKEVVQSEIKRIDAKIDGELKGLNKRIDDMKSIKFWSVRTVVDVILAAIALIATLYAAGVRLT